MPQFLKDLFSPHSNSRTYALGIVSIVLGLVCQTGLLKVEQWGPILAVIGGGLAITQRAALQKTATDLSQLANEVRSGSPQALATLQTVLADLQKLLEAAQPAPLPNLPASRFETLETRSDAGVSSSVHFSPFPAGPLPTMSESTPGGTVSG